MAMAGVLVGRDGQFAQKKIEGITKQKRKG
jgi:hypothetical protein